MRLRTPVRAVCLALGVIAASQVASPAAGQQRAPTPAGLGQLLGVARGCDDRKALPALTACLQRYTQRQASPAATRKALIAASEKAQKSPWLERPGVCHRAIIAVREMPLWKTLCKDLGPPPY